MCHEIKRFVRETLGCSCPEEVFNNIDCQQASAGTPGRKVNVGGRLLIYIIGMDGKSGIQGIIESALEQGVGEREKKGFNRFRLVLVTSRPEELHRRAGQAFDNSGYTDERTHLHIVSESDVEGIMNA